MIEYTKYIYPTPEIDGPVESPFFLSLSNNWSRKSINFIFSDELGTTLWTLQNKSKFLLPDENGIECTEIELPSCFESFDIVLESWINKTIIRHIDFLLGKLQSSKKES